jgi:hypothetical protein
MQQPGPAWQPFTPRGVAAFAYAPLSRLWLVQGIVGLLAGGVLIWFLSVNWAPVIHEIIHELPESARLVNQELSGIDRAISAQRQVFSIGLEPVSTEASWQTADLQLQFRRRSGRLCSILGCLFFNYPAGLELKLGRSVVEPWWGAWQPMLLAGAGALTAISLLAGWALIALLYSIPAKVLGYYADRDATWLGSWKLAGASLLPGAVFLTGAIILYGLQWIDLLLFLWFFGVHLVIGWIYAGCAPFFLAPLPSNPRMKKNPFSSRVKKR